jgi:HD-GYP domain-containing protein (c-di-GMP phosphodiesterase class II)
MIKNFFFVVLKEFIDVRIYLTALFIGGVINWATMGNPFYSWIPYMVPILVQVFSRTMMKIQYQSKEQLLLLPSMRKDPSFVMNQDGDILYSQGKTKDFLKKYDITNFNQFSDEDILSVTLNRIKTNNKTSQELYFDPEACWYEIQSMENPQKPEIILVWFTNITANKGLIKQLREIQKFSQQFQVNIDEQLDFQDTWARMAELVISHQYSSVFIAEKRENFYSGKIYKLGERSIESSDLINIQKDSEVSLLASRKQHGLVSGNQEDYPDREEFFKSFPFAPEVQNFLEEPITNFINFHSGELSIIAFNHQGLMGPQDKIAIEIQVNTAWTINNLLALAQENRDRFSQSIEGLCAASEFSDEVTGKHIYRVNEFSSFIAEKMGFPKKTVRAISQVAAIHDIGKVAVPHLIKLQRAFTLEERIQMQMHTIYGGQILNKMMEYGKEDENLKLACTIAICHHQQWNGKGYPGIKKANGEWTDLSEREPAFYNKLQPLKAEEIPTEALLVSLADRYDALRSTRQYKKGFSHKETLEILSLDNRSGETGTEIFGQQIFEVLMQHHKSMEEIYEAMKD